MDVFKKNCRNNSKETYVRHYKRVKEVLGWRKLNRLNLVVMQDALNGLRTDNERKNTKKILVDMLEKAAASDLIYKNVAKQLITEYTKEEKKKRRVLTVEETRIFLEEAQNTSYYPLFVVALETGMRIGEFSGLQWEDKNNEKQEDIADMEQYKEEFIEFMVESDVLKFGEFTLKSGRKSPFFMNAGAYVTGSQLKRLGEYYAKAIHDNYGEDFDVLFGPAYKGIPLSVATVIAFYGLYGKEIRYCSNRKEIKDHGDVGILLGSKITDKDRVVIIEDVTTSGKSIEETFPILKEQGDVEIVGLMVSLNRMEKGKGGEKSALDEIRETYGFPTAAIVTMEDVVERLYNKECHGRVVIDDKLKAAIDEYFQIYGVK